jgi:hypothetical protein
MSAMGTVKKGPLTMKDLKPASYNPRKISEASRAALAKSMSDLGDISGIVWNETTGNLVCGHQRVDQLRKLGAVMEGSDIVLPSGERFAVRVVRWDTQREKLANMAANNPKAAGEFTDGAEDLLEEILNDVGEEYFEQIGFDELLSDLEIEEVIASGGDSTIDSAFFDGDDGSGMGDGEKCPTCGRKLRKQRQKS